MVRAWYMDDSTDDKRLPHLTNPPRYVDLDALRKIGVLYFEVNADGFPEIPKLKKIREDRGYNYEDHIEIHKDKLPNYDEKLNMFFKEHLHADEEIRYCLEGSGYFDVRDKEDKWIRIFLEKNDLIILPAGIYHRFTLDSNNYIKAARYFVGEPVWTPHDRPADDMDIRKKYVSSLS